jgi:GNAT superfamily N-acetyltransferase
MLSIRRAISDDIDQLVRLRLLLFEEAGDPLQQKQAEALKETTRVYLTRFLPQETFLAWVAESDRQIVATSGLVLFERPPAPGSLSGQEAYVLNMYTLPQWRGQGLATALLQEIIHFTKRTTIKRLWLHATESGRPIYEKAGFVIASDEMELTW